MKRIFAISLAIAMLAVAAFGCSNRNNNTEEETTTTPPIEVSANVRQALESFLAEYLGEDITNTEFMLYDFENDGVPEVLIRRNRNDFVFDVYRYNPSQFTRVGEISMPLAFYRNSEGQPLRRIGGQFELISFGNGLLMLEELENIDAAQVTRIERLTALQQSVTNAVVQQLVDNGLIDPDAVTTLPVTETANGTTGTTLPGQTTTAGTTGTGNTTTTQAGGATGNTTTTARPPTTTAGGGGGGQITFPTNTTAPPAQGQADRVLTTPISVQNNTAAALAQFNQSVNRIVNQNAGFSKRHQVTQPHFIASPEFEYAGFLSMANMVAPAVEHVLRGLPTSVIRERGFPTQTISTSTLVAGDLNSATATQAANGNWTITLNVRNASTSQGDTGAMTGTALLSRGPIARQVDPGGPIQLPIADDHSDARQIRDALTEGFRIFQARASRVQENTTNARYVLTLDRYGNPISLICIFNQNVNFDIQFSTNAYRNNTATFTTTITFDNFRFR